ncbi:MAG: trehalose-phosphatase [Micrococcales bacterium]|nr:trehalose-phosphatase [Micrococcales bacterium]
MLPTDLQDALAAAADRENVLLATDFDGVLAPLQDDPLASRPIAGSLDALRESAAVPGTTVALVSGRDKRVLSSLTGVGSAADDPIVLIASHGTESSHPQLVVPATLGPAEQELLARLETAMTQVAADHPGSRVEVKPTAVVLHTRGIDPQLAASAAAAAGQLVDSHEGSHYLHGKDIVELGVVELSKGTALRQLGRAVGAQATIYFGDDVTDERAFAVLDPARGDVTVKVGPGETLATHRLDGVPDVLQALSFFAAQRTGRA